MPLLSAGMMAMTVAAVSAADNSSVSASKISLPSGPGSIEGLGESFQPQLNTGSYAMGLPFKLPPVRGAVQSEVRLSYNSGSGNGPLGLGWQLDVPCLQRQTDKGLPHYDDSTDTFINHAREELVRLADGTLRAKNETDFSKHENLGANGWKVTRRDGTILRFGQTTQARQDHPALGTFRWMIESAEDLNGNRVEYGYAKDAGQIYLSAVDFGRHATLPSASYHLTFQYETNRVDSLTDYRGRFRCETRLRLASATLEFEGRRIRFWKMGYAGNVPLTLLASFTLYGDQRSDVDTNALLNVDYLPPVTFAYTPAQFGSGRVWADVGPFAAVSFAQREAELVDLNRDGLQDVLLYDSGHYVSYLDRGPGLPFGSPEAFASPVFYPPLNAPATRLADLRGDGSVKVLVEDTGSYYFRAFTSATTVGVATNYLIPGSFLISDPEVQVVDIDNDRSLDFVATDRGDSTFAMVLSHGGTGSPAIQKSPPTALAQNVSFANGWQFADLNGDRMPDLAAIGTVEDGGTIFYPGKGYGEFDAGQVMSGGPRDADLGSRGRAGLALVDLDLDGLADLVLVDSGVVKVWANHSGKEWAPPVVIADAQVPDFVDGSTAVRFADMNGNGSVDIVWNDPGQTIFLRYLELHPAVKPNLMSKMANGMGRSIEIEYKTSTDYMLAASAASNAWTMVPPFPIPVVSAFTEHDGLGSTYRTEVFYRNGYYDSNEREFRGFETAIRTDVGNDTQGAPSLITEFQFDTGATVESLKGKPLRVERRTAADGVFDHVSTVWTNRQLPVVTATGETRRVTFPFASSEQTQVLELGNGTNVTLLSEFEWDDYGNQTKHSDYGRVEGANRSAWDDERITTRTFTSAFSDGLSRLILGLPITETIADENGVVITRTESFYDDEAFGGANAGNVSRGNLTLQRRLVDPVTNARINVVRNRYDGYGNVTETFDPLGTANSAASGHARQFAYDASLHTQPVTETIHVGGGNPALIASAAYDLGLGVMTNSFDFNGNASAFTFDTFGRIAAITKPGDTAAFLTELYAYQLGISVATNRTLNFIEAKKRETVGGGTVDSRLFFDGLGRKVMVRAEGETPEQTVVSDTVIYNNRRAVWKKYLPYFDSGGLDWRDPTFVTGFVEHHYDALGRVTRASQPEVDGVRVFAETTYEPLAKLIKDEEQTNPGSVHFGSAMRHIQDGLQNKDGDGRLRQVQEIVKISDSGEALVSPITWTTSYAYDLLDNLVHITDSQNNVKTFSYDGLSRKLFMNDPDRGVMTWTYDDGSNLRQTVDAKAQVIAYTYDGVNRLLTEDYLDAAGLTPDVAYVYDTPTNVPAGDGTTATNTQVKGKLSAVTDLSGAEVLSYDARGRLASKIKRIPDSRTGVLVSYQSRFNYDSLDRVTSLTYPDGDTVGYDYNARNLPQSITGGPSGFIISGMEYRASGQLETTTYGNGVVTSYQYDPRLRLTALDTRHSTLDTRLIDFTYDFDGASNIRRIDDNRPGFAAGDPRKNTQVFGYDDLYRLTSVLYPEILAGSPANIAYAYDRIGNMLSQTSNIAVVENGLPLVNLGSMGYGGTAGPSGRIGRNGSQPGPHALSEIRQSAIGNRQYPYDANGNMENIDDLACTWDFKDRLVRVENTNMVADYTYDHTDRRISKHVGYRSVEGERPREPLTTLYIDRTFEIREDSSPVKYVWNGETRVARVTANLNATQRIQRFRLQSGWNLCTLAVAITNAGTQLSVAPVQSVRRYDENVQAYVSVAANETLPAGTLLSVRANAVGELPVRGTPVPPAPTNFPAGRHWVGNATFQPMSLGTALPADASLWFFDAAAQTWQFRFPGTLSSAAEIPARLEPGEAVFAIHAAPFTLTPADPTLEVRFYHQDHLGSSSVMTDASGQLVKESAFYPFGHPRNEHEPRGVKDPYGFTQKEEDPESGLSYFEARYLATALGRFTRVDPLANAVKAEWLSDPQRLNMYAYCEQSPINRLDPSGMSDWKATAFVPGGAGLQSLTPTGTYDVKIPSGGSPAGVGGVDLLSQLMEFADQLSVFRRAEEFGSSLRAKASEMANVLKLREGTLTSVRVLYDSKTGKVEDLQRQGGDGWWSNKAKGSQYVYRDDLRLSERDNRAQESRLRLAAHNASGKSSPEVVDLHYAEEQAMGQCLIPARNAKP